MASSPVWGKNTIFFDDRSFALFRISANFEVGRCDRRLGVEGNAEAGLPDERSWMRGFGSLLWGSLRSLF
jgi:hypothetical protein